MVRNVYYEKGYIAWSINSQTDNHNVFKTDMVVPLKLQQNNLPEGHIWRSQVSNDGQCSTSNRIV